MTKTELSKYDGGEFYALVSRMGGKFTDIYCLTRYAITSKGTCRYITEVINCVANKAQYQYMRTYTNGNYAIGRPSAKNLTKEILAKILL